MNDPREILEKLRDTDAAIALGEQAIARGPKSASIDTMVASIRKRQQKLQRELEKETDSKTRN